MPKKKLKEKTLQTPFYKIEEMEDPLYGSDVTFIVSESAEKVRDYLRNKCKREPILLDEHIACCICHPYLSDNKACKEYHPPLYIIYLPFSVFSQPKSRIVSILAHEALHLTLQTLGRVGMEAHLASEEAYTYHFESVFRSCYKQLEEWELI